MKLIIRYGLFDLGQWEYVPSLYEMVANHTRLSDRIRYLETYNFTGWIWVDK